MGQDATVGIGGVHLTAVLEDPFKIAVEDPNLHTKILKYPHSALKTACSEAPNYQQNIYAVTKLKQAIAKDNSDRQIVGLAANQVGITDARVFVLDKHFLKLQHSEYINPVITGFVDSPTEILDESCMSFPDTVTVPIRRRTMIRLSFFDMSAQAHVCLFSGLAAQAVQHELDHLNGKTLYQNATVKMQKHIFRMIEQARRR